jgi:ornithine cyclodeaminase
LFSNYKLAFNFKVNVTGKREGKLMQLFNLKQIKSVVGKIDLTSIIEEGFVAYSQGKVVVPPVGELIFDNPPGDTHIKYGYIKDDDFFVIKIASGFYENYKLDLPSSSGLMLLFSQKTGMLASVLIDEGYLTNVRTAIAGRIVAKYLSPKKVTGIGVFGTGIQARMQVSYLENVTNCRNVVVWGLPTDDFDSYKHDMEAVGYHVTNTLDSEEVTKKCNLIITATPSRKPLIRASQIKSGMHITAMGSDTPIKQELDSKIFEIADIVVADSISQCKLRGEIFKALQAGHLQEDNIFELGDVIMKKDLQRSSDDQVTVCDLTGVAVQDIQIAKAVYRGFTEQ